MATWNEIYACIRGEKSFLNMDTEFLYEKKEGKKLPEHPPLNPSDLAFGFQRYLSHKMSRKEMQIWITVVMICYDELERDDENEHMILGSLYGIYESLQNKSKKEDEVHFDIKTRLPFLLETALDMLYEDDTCKKSVITYRSHENHDEKEMKEHKKNLDFMLSRKDFRAFLYLGDFALEQGKVEEALEYYRKAHGYGLVQGMLRYCQYFLQERDFTEFDKIMALLDYTNVIGDIFEEYEAYVFVSDALYFGPKKTQNKKGAYDANKNLVSVLADLKGADYVRANLYYRLALMEIDKERQDKKMILDYLEKAISNFDAVKDKLSPMDWKERRECLALEEKYQAK